jgi:16S rRNA (cytosine967-C5)-methyltransferase
MTTPAPAGRYAPGATVLAAAAQGVALVVEGATAEDALARLDPPPAERAAVRAVLSGSLRWYLRLAPVVQALRDPGRRRPQPLLEALLVAALHQVEYSQSAPQSVVNIAVDAARVLDLGPAAGFVNAQLRRFLRERRELLARVDLSPATSVAHPRWLLRALEAAWPEQAASIVAANNEAPPMTLRVDLSRRSREDCLARLAAAGIPAVAGPLPTTVVLEQAVGVDRLPGFTEGEVSVQDAGAQLAAWLLDARPGERVLDACAAPGGKTGHLLEHTPGLAGVVALDKSAVRLERVAQNLNRLRREARLVAADLTSDLSWWDGVPFDRIFVDAPCSGTGVIRRHPDIKLLRRASDTAGFVATQVRLLTAAAQLLRPGGRLLYATCSVLPEENDGVVEALTVDGGPLRQAPLDLAPLPPEFRAVAARNLQLLPRPWRLGTGQIHDGFHYACLTSGG